MAPQAPIRPAHWPVLALRARPRLRPRPHPHPHPHPQLQLQLQPGLPSGHARCASWLAALSGFGRGPAAVGARSAGPDEGGTQLDARGRGVLPPGTRVYTQSKVLPYSQSQLFDMVADVDRYHEFLPFCTMSRVVGPALPDSKTQAQAQAQAQRADEQAEPSTPAVRAGAGRMHTRDQHLAATELPPRGSSIFTIPVAPEGSISAMRGPGVRRSEPRHSPLTALLARLQPPSGSANEGPRLRRPPTAHAHEPVPLAPQPESTAAATQPCSSAQRGTSSSHSDGANPRSVAAETSTATAGGATARVLADLGIGYGAFREEYRSLVEMTGREEVRATAVPGSNPLFTHLSTTWRLSPAGAAQSGTKIEYQLAYGFANPAHAWVASAVFGRTAALIMRAFEQRAQALYG